MSYLPEQAHRLRSLPPYPFATIGQRIQQMTAAGKDVIRFDIGSPDLPPSDAVIDALKASSDHRGHYQYGSYRGDPQFRKAVSHWYERRFGVTLDPEKEILPLIGSKEGIVNFSLAYLDQGSYAIVGDIHYPAYSMGARLAGGDVIEVKLDPARGFLPNFESLPRDLTKAKLLWINYPNNPIGAIADLAFYEEAVAFCKKHHIILCSDNPYCDVTYDGYRAPSALEVPGAKDVTVEFWSLSKTFNLAGIRLGAAVGNREALDALLTVKSNMDSGHFKAIYDAGTAAMNTTSWEWIEERNARYAARRNLIYKALPELGLEAEKFPASLYVWARVAGGDDMQYANDALTHAQVAVAPGSIYGPGGKGYVRLSLTVPDVRLEEALRRLRQWYPERVAS